MKKFTAFSITLALLLSSAACGTKNGSPDTRSADTSVSAENQDTSAAETSGTAAGSPTAPLACHMTEKELSNIKEGELTVFDHEQPACPVPQEGVAIEVRNKQENIEYWKKYREKYPDTDITDENISEIIAYYEQCDDDLVEYITGYVDGEGCVCQCPPAGYDGGEFTVQLYPHRYCSGDDNGNWIYYDENDNEITQEEYMKEPENLEEKTYANFDELKEYIKDEVEFTAKKLYYMSDKETEAEYQREIRLWEAVISGEFTTLPSGTSEKYRSWKYDRSGAYWEIDHDSVMAIKDYVREYRIYDEQMNMYFTVHVTTPPDYDPEKSYPAYVLTDGVWRFNNCADMRKAMEDGKAGDVILISIGLDYMVNGMDDEFRKEMFCKKSEGFLDFITDDLMPYLGNKYRIDFSTSTLYGHSLGGTFAHYALFNSDKYENQPFHNYIIGSPAFWSPGFLPYVDQKEVLSDYYYFDRNATLDKRVFVRAGADEDPVYEEYHGDNDSTIEGVEHLMERLREHGVTDAESKLYPDSEHYQFIPEMLIETLVKFYPAEK